MGSRAEHGQNVKHRGSVPLRRRSSVCSEGALVPGALTINPSEGARILAPYIQWAALGRCHRPGRGRRSSRRPWTGWLSLSFAILKSGKPRLAGTTGAEFIAVFEDEARKLGHIPWLAQGTLYPDVIESVSFRGAVASQ